MSKSKIIGRIAVLTLMMGGLISQGRAQGHFIPLNGGNVTISGPTSVIGGWTYTYTCSPAKASTALWGAVNGTTDFDNSTSTATNVTWTTTPSTGQVKVTSNTGLVVGSLTVTILAPLTGGSITNSPLTQNINYNTTPAQITASLPTNGTCGGSYTYQWESSPHNSTWSFVSGATSQNYQPPALTTTTYYRRRTFCTPEDAYTTNVATVNVYPQLGAATLSPSSQTINYNTVPSSLNVTSVFGGNGSYTYQWQSCSTINGTYTSIGGATGSSYTPAALTATTYYEVLTTSNGVTVPSAAVTVNVYPQLQVSATSPSSQSVNYNTVPASLGLVFPGATGGNGSYSLQWQSCTTSNGTYTAISGATGWGYTPPALTSSLYYALAITSNGVTVPSSPAFVNVYPQLNSGTIIPSPQTINYNSIPATFSLSGTTGGSGTYTYQWESSPASNGTYTYIPGATSSSYTAPPLTSTTYYHVIVTSNGVQVTSDSAAVNVNPQLIPGLIYPGNISIASGTNPGPMTANPASGGACSGSYAYQWQSSPNNSSWTNISGMTGLSYSPGNLSSAIYYRIRVICGIDTEYTVLVKVSIGSVNTSMNYVRERTFSMAGLTDTVAANLLTSPADVQQTTQYFDGLGRPAQTVVRQASPLQNDMVVFNIYDPLGRESTQFLPYVSPSGDGNYKANFLSEQNTFNSAQFPGESFYYSQADYESSPLNRVRKAFAPGIAWEGSRGSGNEKSVQKQYLFNTAADSVRIWTIGFTAGAIPASTTTYAAGQLYKTIVTDEAGHQSVEYGNMLGQTVLTKVQLSGTPGMDHTGWLCTYYIYDDLGNLRSVLQPRAIELIKGAWTISQTIADELSFRYEYDARHRISIKKEPGAWEFWIVYDARDRVVMTQDSSLRSHGKWMVVEYDSYNRSSRTGLLTDAHNRAYHQNLANNSTTYPNTSSNYEVLTQKYYDDYTWVSGTGTSLGSSLDATNTTNSSYFITSYNSSPTYARQITQSILTRGMPTGVKSKVIGTTSTYLYSVNFYDDRGRAIQNQSINFSGGKDIITTQYDFTGKGLRNFIQHQKSGSNAQSHSILTKLEYDPADRVKRIWKNIDNAGADQLIDSLQYNELGQVKEKYLGSGVDSIAYDYNIRGWLTGINKNYVAGGSANYFGMEIGYNKTASIASTTSYTNPQFNGNIGGTVWRSKGDGIGRKYDFTYDTTGRLTAANFVQNTTGSSWDNSTVDFSVYHLSYDANGNLLTMNQKGFKIGGSSLIDSLTYSYFNSNASNRLNGVTDAVNDTTAKLGDFHYNPATKQATDYSYDGNGNFVSDNNKAIDQVTYNYLNLPQLIHVKGKGNIQYVYDASGSRLQKIITDSAGNKVTTTTYIGSFIYQSYSALGGSGTDTLQFINHEDGRIRWAFHRYLNGTTGYKFEYDYFLKDHQNATRIVLTQQKDTALYIATMEAAYRTTENALFYNIPASSYYRGSVSGYPTDNTTTPNDSVSRVNGSNQKTGPGILLKVMSGDNVDIAAKSFYTSQTGTGTSSSFSDVLTSLATGMVGITGGAKGTLAQLNTSGSPLYNALNTFMTANDPDPSGKPKAYLNWMLLDDQFNYVGSYPQSGAVPVGNFTAGTLGTPGYSGIPVTKNGYLYVWVSNETQGWDVFFDNLSVQHRSGPLLEETHYYPFGLTMAAISDKALKTKYAENKDRYNGGTELQNKEFSDGSGLELYETPFRSYDPQIGRFHQFDPLADRSLDYSPYAYCENDPISYLDPMGTTRITDALPCRDCLASLDGKGFAVGGGPGADWAAGASSDREAEVEARLKGGIVAGNEYGDFSAFWRSVMGKLTSPEDIEDGKPSEAYLHSGYNKVGDAVMRVMYGYGLDDATSSTLASAVVGVSTFKLYSYNPGQGDGPGPGGSGPGGPGPGGPGPSIIPALMRMSPGRNLSGNLLSVTVGHSATYKKFMKVNGSFGFKIDGEHGFGLIGGLGASTPIGGMGGSFERYDDGTFIKGDFGSLGGKGGNDDLTWKIPIPDGEISGSLVAEKNFLVAFNEWLHGFFGSLYQGYRYPQKYQ